MAIAESLAHKAVATETCKPAVFVWACVGIVALLFEFYVLGKWISGPHFVSTSPAPICCRKLPGSPG